MTVTELIQQLKQLDGDLPVEVEGCDCADIATLVETRNGHAVIGRSDGVYHWDRYDEAKVKK